MSAASIDLRSADSKSLEERVAELNDRLRALEGKVQLGATVDRLSMVVFSGSLDHMLAAFVLATTAAASGMEVDMFFTFWGLAALRDSKKTAKKDLIGRMFGWMLPRGHKKLKLSQMDMGGAGRVMIKTIMKNKNFADIDEMLKLSAEMGVNIWACDMSREIMGIHPDELIDYPKLGYCGATAFLEKASSGRVTLFI